MMEISLVPIYEGYDVINTRVYSYGLNDANLNWKDIHDLQFRLDIIDNICTIQYNI